ncbi:MAG: tetratricopeptide repeat protein [Lentisphaeria bacterium]
MKMRFNWRLLLAAAMILVTVTAGVGALWWFAVHRNPARYVAKADLAVKDGRYKDAIPLYGRAIRYTRKPIERVPTLLKMAEAFRNMPVTEPVEAYFCFQNVMSIHNQVSEIDPANRPALAILTGDLFRIASDTGATADWERLLEKADLMLKNPPVDPLALKYRGLARFTVASRGKLEDKDSAAIRQDLEAANKLLKNDPEPANTLAMLSLLEGRQKLNLGQRSEANAKFQEARKRLDAYAAAHPDVPMAQLNAIRLTREVAGMTEDDVLAAHSLERAGALENSLKKQDDPETARQLAAFFWANDREMVILPNGTNSTRGVERGLNQLERLLAKHPDDLACLIDLGRQYRVRERFAEAVAMFSRATTDRKVTPGPDILRIRNQQLMARYELISTLLEQRNQAANQAERDKLQKQVEDLFTVLKKEAGPAPAVELLEGKLAFVNGQYWEAINKLASADSKFERRNNEVALWLGKSLLRLGQTSASINGLERAVMANDLPGRWRADAAQELAQALMAMRFYADAATLTRSLVKALPENSDPKLILASILLEQARTVAPDKRSPLVEEARHLVEPLAKTGHLEAGRLLASIEFIQEQPAAARDRLLALAGRDATPALPVLRDLLAIERASNRVSPQLRALLLNYLKPLPDSDPKRQALALLAPEAKTFPAPLGDLLYLAAVKDGFQQTLGMYQYYQARQQPAAAATALEQAAKLKPDSGIITSIRFDDAVRAKQYAAAQTLVDEAGKTGLTSAEVKFMQGQLALAQNRPQDAITVLNLALAERPQTSEGWALLGNAYRLSGDLRNAELSFTKALELKRDNLAALEGAFITYDALQQREKALDMLRMAAFFTADRNRNMFNLYLNYLGQFGNKQQALAIRRNLIDQTPEDADNIRATAQLLLELRESEQARALIAGLLRKNPDDRASIWALAALELATGKTDDGRARIMDYLKRRGDQATAEDYLLIARYHRQTGRVQPALDAYRQALAKAGQQPPVALLMEAGEQAMAANAFTDATALYRQVLKRQPESDAWNALIEALIRQNQIDEAGQELRRWKEAAPWSSRMAFAEVRLLNERGRVADAEQAATEAIRRDPNNASLYLLRAQIRYTDASENIQAVVKGDLAKALELNPALLLAREMYIDWFFKRNRLDEAAEQLRRLIQIRPETPLYRVQLARVYQQQERTDDLELLLKDAIRQLPGMPVWHQLYASLRLMQNRRADAIAELGKAYELNPVPETVAGYTEALIASNNPKSALTVFEKCPAITAKSALLLALQGRAMAASGHAYSADKVFAKAFGLAGDNFEELDAVVNQYGHVAGPKEIQTFLEERGKTDKSGTSMTVLAKYQIGHGEAAKAIPALEKLRTQLPAESAEQPNVLWLLGMAYYDSRQFLQARGAYEALLKLQPGNSSAINNLAYLLAENLKLPQEALPLAEKAATFWQPSADGRANVLDTLGRVQFLANQPAQAEDSLRRSIAAKALAINHLHLAEVLVARGRVPEAVTCLETAQQLVNPVREKELQGRITAMLRETRAGRATAPAASGWSLDRPPPPAKPATPGAKPVTPATPPAAPASPFDGPPPARPAA